MTNKRPHKKNKTKLCLYEAREGKADKTDPVAKFTYWVAIATFLLAFMAMIQTFFFIASERSFLDIATIKFNDGFASNKDLSLAIKIKNSGKSTGFIDDLNFTSIFIKSDKKLPSTPDYKPAYKKAVGPVLSDDFADVEDQLNSNDGKNLSLTDETVTAINAGKINLYIYGYISYSDDFTIFGSRRNGFCFVYNPHGNVASTFNRCVDSTYTYMH